jgi:membrane-associated phospholipid phosphatase
MSAGAFASEMQLVTRDSQLLAADTVMLGATPSVFLQAVQSYWLTELMSGCYLWYLFYLHAAIFCTIFATDDFIQRFANWIFSIFAIGFSGYLIVPAIGPAFAFPELFQTPLVGGPITSFNAWVVEQGSNRVDAFPSLHVLVTCSLLVFDYRHVSRRFAWMLLPSIGTIISTVYLRYHYLVDLLASVVLLLISIAVFRCPRKSDELY